MKTVEKPDIRQQSLTKNYLLKYAAKSGKKRKIKGEISENKSHKKK